MSTSKESLALVVPVPEVEEEGGFDLAPLNFQSNLVEMDLFLLHEQFQIP